MHGKKTALYYFYDHDNEEERNSFFLPTLFFHKLLDLKLIGDERRNMLREYLKKKRGMRDTFLSCDIVFLPLNWLDH
eukprot:6225651-Ditylum_brightwellii.AAC.1